MITLTALLDGSVYGESVCDHTAWAARATGGAVQLLHVLGPHQAASEKANLSGSIGLGARTALLDELSELDAQQSKLAQRRGRAILDDAKARLQESGIQDVTAKLRHDDLLEALDAFERDSDIIVVGKRGEAADFAKMHLGSNLERIVRSIHKPILVASREFKPIRSCLVAFDGGASAFKAVEYISKSPMFNDVACHLLSVGKDDTANQRRLLEAQVLLEDAGVEVSTEIHAGQAERVICETLRERDADLLVMGAYGHSRIRNLIIGSTTTEMVRSSLRPVMLFR